MDYSNYLYKPFDKTDRERLEQFPEFQFKHKDKENLINFIILMWDFRNREWQSRYTDYYEMKREAAKLAGLKSDDSGHYSKDIEDILVGANEEFNTAVIRYLYLFGEPELVNLAAQRELQSADYMAAFSSKNLKPGDREKIGKNIAASTAQILYSEGKVFGGQEVENVRKALYKHMESEKLRLRPEYVAEDIKGKKLKVKKNYHYES